MFIGQDGAPSWYCPNLSGLENRCITFYALGAFGARGRILYLHIVLVLAEGIEPLATTYQFSNWFTASR